MMFTDARAQDKQVFFNTNEWAQRVTVDGTPLDAVVSEESDDAIDVLVTVMRAQTSDLPPLTATSVVEIDGKRYGIVASADESGVTALALNRID